MRLLVLWTFETDYVHASLEFAASQGHEVILVLQAPHVDLPQEPRDRGYVVVHEPTPAQLREVVWRFNPDTVLIAGWHIKPYRTIARELRGKATRLMATDAQWHGTLRQHLGRVAFRLYLRGLYDYAFVPGPRQAQYVSRMGFSASRTRRGSIPANDALFAPSNGTQASTGFLTVSRLAPEKGIGQLLDAYELYRESCTNPWPLRIAGIGPEPIRPLEGVIQLGYLSAADAASEMRRSGAFVIASTFEPWGVVIHEAALSALPIIATDACGAAGVLVVDGLNGWVVPSNDPLELSEALRRVSEADDKSRRTLSEASRALGLTSTRASWLSAIEAALADHAAERRQVPSV